DALDDRTEIQIASGRPRLREQIGKQDVLAALHGVCIDAEQSEQSAHGGRDPFTQRGGIGERVLGRGGKGAQDGQGATAVAARRIYSMSTASRKRRMRSPS